VVGAVLHSEHVVVVVRAEGDRPGQHRHVARGRQRRRRRGDPLERGPAVNQLAPARQQGAAELGLLVQEHDACVRPGCGQRGGEAGRAAADDEDVGVDELLVVDGVVMGRVEDTESGQRARGEAVHQLPRGRRNHRLRAVPADLQQGVGLLDTRGGDAAGPAPVDGVAHAHPAVGQQRGRDGVTGVARVVDAVDGEGQDLVAVDPSSRGEAVGLGAHGEPPASEPAPTAGRGSELV
jgi:hypothetical protein